MVTFRAMRVKNYFKQNKFIILFLCCTIFGSSLYANLTHVFNSSKQLALFPPFIEGINLNYNKHLGAEYYFIARALASGKGFSNPFQEDTGPTAWMPPVYPFFLALLIKLLRSTFLVACIVVFLKNIILLSTGLVINETAKRTLKRIQPAYVVVFYGIYLVTHFRWFFQITHDVWILLLLMCVLYCTAVFINENRIGLTCAVNWGICGGLTALASPILGIVWFLLVFFTIATKKNGKVLMVSTVLGCLLVSSWGVRNYIVFNKLIPIKSNFYYEVYSTNFETDDGLFDESMLTEEPVWTLGKDAESPYRKLGEIKFLEKYEEKFFSAFRQNPYAFLSNVKNRFVAAVLVYHPYNHTYEKSMVCKQILHILPFIGIMLVVFLRGYTGSVHIRIALLMYVVYLLPYIIASYYIRYAIPLTPLKILFIFWGVDLTIPWLEGLFNNNRDSTA